MSRSEERSFKYEKGIKTFEEKCEEIANGLVDLNADNLGSFLQEKISDLSFWVSNRSAKDEVNVEVDENYLEIFSKLMTNILKNKNFCIIAKSLKNLDLSRTFAALLPDYFNKFAETLLPHFIGLEYLNLKNNSLEGGQLEEISKAILKMPKLQQLNLADNLIRGGFEKFFPNKPLQHLDIEGNYLSGGSLGIVNSGKVKFLKISAPYDWERFLNSSSQMDKKLKLDKLEIVSRENLNPEIIELLKPYAKSLDVITDEKGVINYNFEERVPNVNSRLTTVSPIVRSDKIQCAIS